jgi:hypothetical protein
MRHLATAYIQGGESSLDPIDKIKWTAAKPEVREALVALHEHYSEQHTANNEEAKRINKAKFAAEEAERTRPTREAKAAVEAALKQRERHGWLAANPTQGDVDFERVWPHILATINSSATEQYVADRMSQKRASGGGRGF